MTIACVSTLSGNDDSVGPAEPRDQVVAAAVSQLGFNDPAPYWEQTLPTTYVGPFPKDWCGSFCLWCLNQAGLALDAHWIVGRGFLMVPPNVLPMTKEGQKGDIAYFEHNQHHAVIEEVTDHTYKLINGNGAGGRVTRSEVPRGQVTAVFSIAPYIESFLNA